MSPNSPTFPPKIRDDHLFHKAIMSLKWNNKYESQPRKGWQNITGVQPTRAYCSFAVYSEDPWSQSLYSTQFQTSFIHIIAFPQTKAHLEHRFSHQIKLCHLWLKLDTLSGIPRHSETPVALWKNLRVPGNIVRRKPSPLRHTEGSVCVPHAGPKAHCSSSLLPSLSSSSWQRSSGLCIPLQHRGVDDPVGKMKMVFICRFRSF